MFFKNRKAKRTKPKSIKRTCPTPPLGGWGVLFLFISLSLSAIEPPKHEIRGIWITTIYGLDWPSSPATNEQSRLKQQKELCNILDKLQDANFNTLFLQVRLRGDVIYPSAIEPASRVFSGKYGISPGYDPLAYAIEECHKRGMECHAWFVTFPVGTDQVVKAQGSRSIVKKKPELCKKHNGEWYLDPGIPGTTDYLLSLIRELVTQYDIDGIHFDYIRYPDKADRYPDKSIHTKYGKGTQLAAWRRENINRIVRRLYDAVKEIKPWVQVSSAPLGKYNRIEKNPNAGWTAYETVHQDPKVWMETEKHDMIVPMMYYLHNDFFPFVDNWAENANGRLVIPGLGAYRLDKNEGDWELNDITDQIDYSRYFGGAGTAFFRAEHILNNTKGIYDELANKYYQYPAQLPPLTWLDNTPPETPGEIRVEKNNNELKLSWQPLEEDTYTYTVYYSLTDSIDTGSPKNILMTRIRGTELYLPVQEDAEIGFTFSLTATNRYHIESEPSRETYYYHTQHIK